MTEPADPEVVLAELARLPIGEALGRDHLARLARIGRLEHHAPGACLFRKSDPNPELRLVLSGRVSLCLETPGHETLVVGALSRGDLLGWSALQPDLGEPRELGPAIASAVAAKATTCLSFPGKAVRELCDLDHELGYYIMRHALAVVARRLDDTRMQLIDVYGERR